jgi:protein-disulfide isomerase-like protein with CxxC motif
LFIYGTEPACRAVGKIRNLKAGTDYLYLSALQRAFYVSSRDLTQVHVLAEIVAAFKADRKSFLQQFDAPEIREETHVIVGIPIQRHTDVVFHATLNGAIV